MTRKDPVAQGEDRAVREFVEAIRRAPVPAEASSMQRGRLLFAMDATASRERSWDQASALHAEMFDAAMGHGGLSVQLCFYRGHRELRASAWQSEATGLLKLMSSVRCRAGRTQIQRLLAHVQREHARARLGAAVFVGDSFEESLDEVADLAGELGIRGCPLFLFQEGRDEVARHAFQSLAHLSRGAWCPFDGSSAAQLRELLRAVATYVAGGYAAMQKLTGRGSTDLVRRLERQLGPR